MRLDKNHLDQFENIQPPMRAALSLPVLGKEGIIVYVCASPFARAERGSVRVHKDVLAVAEALKLDGTDLTDDLARRLAEHDGCSRFGRVDFALLEAVRLTRGTPRHNPELQAAIDEAKAALVGDSDDAEHEALVSLIEALVGEVPECKCDNIVGKHDKGCPAKEWEGGGK
jgi:hypothetical protein